MCKIRVGMKRPSIFVAPKGRRKAGDNEDYAKDGKGGVDSCFLGQIRERKEGKNKDEQGQKDRGLARQRQRQR